MNGSTKNSNADKNTEVSDEQKKNELLVKTSPVNSGERDGDARSSLSYEDDYEDDIEEECSISIGNLTDDESVQNGGEKPRTIFEQRFLLIN